MIRLVLAMGIALSGGWAQAKAMLPAEATEILKEQLPAAVAEPVAAAPAEASIAVPMKEAEIPLNLEKKKDATSEGNPLGRFLLGVAVLLAIAIGAFFYLRRYAKPGQRKSAPQIKVLSQHWLGPKKSLAIIRVAGESVLIGVTEQNITMIKSLALLDEDVPEDAPEKFEAVLDETANRREAPAASTDDEEFQMSGLNQIKDVVHRRLKGMRNLQ